MSVLKRSRISFGRQSNEHLPPTFQLANVFSLVNKRFYTICQNSDYLWKSAFLHQMKKTSTSSEVWDYAIKSFIATCDYNLNDSIPNKVSELTTSNATCNEDETLEESLLNVAVIYLEHLLSFNKVNHGKDCHPFATLANETYKSSSISIYNKLYHHLKHQHLCHTAPIICDTQHQQSFYHIGKEYTLYFGEKTIVEQINSLMSRYPETFQHGQCMYIWNHHIPSSLKGVPESIPYYDPKYPTFVFTTKDITALSNQAIGSVANIVQIRKCYTFLNLSAEVTFVPIAHVKIEQITKVEKISSYSNKSYDIHVGKATKLDQATYEKLTKPHLHQMLTKPTCQLFAGFWNRVVYEFDSIVLLANFLNEGI